MQSTNNTVIHPRHEENEMTEYLKLYRRELRNKPSVIMEKLDRDTGLGVNYLNSFILEMEEEFSKFGVI